MAVISFQLIYINSHIDYIILFHLQKVNDMWEMLKYMLELPPYPKNEDPIISRNSKSVKGILVEQAKKYLEERYYNLPVIKFI